MVRGGVLTVLLTAVACALAPEAQGAPAGTTHLPDIQTIIPTNSFSIVQGTEGNEFRYTHLVYNNGPGPLEIQPRTTRPPAATRASSSCSPMTRAELVAGAQRKVPDAFHFHAAHGHFHFPLASFGLYAVAPDGGIGAPVALSPKNGFCIATPSSTTRPSSTPGRSSARRAAAPTRPRCGAERRRVDEYDYRDPARPIPFAGLRTGPTGSTRSPTRTTTSSRPTSPTTRPTSR